MPLLLGALSTACQAPRAVWGGTRRGMGRAGFGVCSGTYCATAFGWRKHAACPCHSSGKGQGWQGRQRHKVALASKTQVLFVTCAWLS